MKRFLFLLVAGLLIATPAMAGLMGASQVVLDADGSTSIGVNVDEVVYTQSIPLYSSDTFGVWFRATSVTGTPSIDKIEIQESYSKPTTEGVDDSNYVEPEDTEDVYATLTTETAHITPISPSPMPYLRFKITGGAANPADTVIKMYIFTQGNT